MKYLSFPKNNSISFHYLFIAIGSANAQLFHKNPEKQLFGKSHRKEPKVKERAGFNSQAKKKKQRKLTIGNLKESVEICKQSQKGL